MAAALTDAESIAIHQGDAAGDKASRVARLVKGGKVVMLQNAEEIFQKTVAVAEMAKRILAKDNIQIYQYNQMEVKDTVSTPSNPLNPLLPPKTHHRKLGLNIVLSTQPVALEKSWTLQRQ